MATAFKKWIFCITACSIISPLGYADTVHIFAAGGPAFSRLSNDTQDVAINNLVVNRYQTNQKTKWDGYWGLGIGHSFENVWSTPYRVSLGLAGYSMNLGGVNGTEFPLINDGIFDTLDYGYRVSSAALLLESRLFYTCYDWQPFALIGIGGAWNHFSDYNETPTNPALSAAPAPQQFKSHTESDFAYELGFGLQRQLYVDPVNGMRYAVSLDYRYINVGKGKLGSFPAQTASDRIHINNLYTQAFTFSFNVSLS